MATIYHVQLEQHQLMVIIEITLYKFSLYSQHIGSRLPGKTVGYIVMVAVCVRTSVDRQVTAAEYFLAQ